MRRTSLILILTLIAGAPAGAEEDSLVMQTSVRYRSPRSQQPSARRRAAASGPDRYQTGDTVRVVVTDRKNPFDVTGGTIRIRSASTGYDSGEQPLVHERDGRSVYFQWRTSKLAPARDYRIEGVVQTKGGAKTRRIELALHPVIVEDVVLEQTTDLALPYWSLGLRMTRQFRYESQYGIYKGTLGHGWSHAYAPVLTEETDGSLSLYGMNGGGTYYTPSGPGTYEPAAGDDSRLTRDPDGVFHLRLANGDLWRFRNDLKAAFVQDVRGNRVSFEYDAAGRLAAVADGSGQRLSFTYDAEGRIAAVTDSTGRRVTYAYDAQGNLEQVRDAAGDLTRYRYDSRHRLVEIVFADGRTRSFEYDDYRRLSRITESGGTGSRSFAYNAGNPTHGDRTISDGMGRATRELSYGDGFLTETRDAAGNTVRQEYDAAFRLSRSVDANGHVWQFASDADAGRDEATSPLGHKTVVTYSPHDRRIASATDGSGRVTTFHYGQGTLETATYPDGVTERRQLLAQGPSLVLERTRRDGATHRYVLDARGLLLQKTLHDGSTAVFGYDDRGNLTRAANAAGTIAMQYDLRDRVTRVTYPGQRVFRYEYDERSRITRVTGPDGDVTTYAYDAGGRLQQIARGGLVARYEYDAAMQRTRRTLGNGVVTDHAYDAAGRLTGIIHRNGATISSWAYALDPNGRRERKTSVDGTETLIFDADGQLRAAGYADGASESFEYDAAGNRTAVVTGAVRSPVSSNVLNQYTGIGGDVLAWDANGNLDAWTNPAGTTRYAWDGEDRLTSVRLPDGSTIAYTYDALGRLRSRTDASGTRLFLWDRMQIALEEDPAHATLRSYTWGGAIDELLESRENGQRFFYLHDAIGSITEVTDARGAVIERHRYRAFGTPATPLPTRGSFLFTGALYEPATGLLYLRNRWYSPIQGRFIQMDPIGIAGGMNLYAYVLNDPVNRKDPLGLCGSRSGSPGAGSDCRACSSDDGSNDSSDWDLDDNYPTDEPRRPPPVPIPMPRLVGAHL